MFSNPLRFTTPRQRGFFAFRTVAAVLLIATAWHHAAAQPPGATDSAAPAMPGQIPEDREEAMRQGGLQRIELQPGQSVPSPFDLFDVPAGEQQGAPAAADRAGQVPEDREEAMRQGGLQRIELQPGQSAPSPFELFDMPAGQQQGLPTAPAPPGAAPTAPMPAPVAPMQPMGMPEMVPAAPKADYVSIPIASPQYIPPEELSKPTMYATLLQAAAAGDLYDTVRHIRGYVSQPGPDAKTPLHSGVESDSAQVIKALLQCGADKMARDSQGRTPLMIAAETGRTEALALLQNPLPAEKSLASTLARVEDVQHIAPSGWSPSEKSVEDTSLAGAAAAGHVIDVVSAIRRFVDAQSVYRVTPLMKACEAGNPFTVKVLLDAGAKAEAWDADRRQPLDYAFDSGHTPVVRMLLDYSPSSARKALLMAMRSANLEMIQAIVEARPALVRDYVDGASPILTLAVLTRNRAIMEYLLSKGAQANLPGRLIGRTPLHHAVSANNLDMVRVLVEHGADPNLTAESGLAPVHYAFEEDKLPIFRYLMDNGGDVELPDCWDFRFIHLAALRNVPEHISLLMGYGANINALDGYGNTALYWAAANGGYETAVYLLERGAVVDYRGQKGLTPLHAAAANGHRDIAEQLLDKGADINARSRDIFDLPPLHVRRGIERLPLMALTRGLEHRAVPSAGMAPIHLAAASGHEGLIELLAEHGASASLTDFRGYTPLHYAASYPDEAPIRLLFDLASPVNKSALDGYTPLHVAALSQRLGNINLLLEHGADPNAADAGPTPLHAACERHYVTAMADCVRVLIDAGAEIEARDSEGRTPLLLAADRGDYAAVKLLLTRGADSDVRDRNGVTPILAASRAGHQELTELFLAQGASADRLDAQDTSPLLAAIQQDNMDIARQLIEAGVEVNVQDDDGLTPLMAAVTREDLQLVGLLLVHGADPNTQDYLQQETALHRAAALNPPELPRLLAKHGAEVGVRDASGRTPLHVAAAANNVSTCHLLLSHGAAVDARDNDGLRPLHYATREGHRRASYMLVARGASATEPANNGATPLHFAAVSDNPSLISLLLDRGGEVNALDGQARSPLHYAAERGVYDGAMALLKNGADPALKDHDDKLALDLATEREDVSKLKRLLWEYAHIDRVIFYAVRHGATDSLRTILDERPHMLTLEKNPHGTPIMWAANEGQAKCIEVLVEYGADPNTCAPGDFTPLHKAAAEGHVEAVRVLLAHGADVNAQNAHGLTPLSTAAQCQHPATAAALLEAGADPDLPDRHGRPPAYYARGATGDQIKALLARYTKQDNAS